MTEAELVLGWWQSSGAMRETGWLFHEAIPGTIVWGRDRKFYCYAQPRQEREHPCLVADTLTQAHEFMVEAAAA